MPDDAAPDKATPGETPEQYLIAPRNKSDPDQLQDLQLCKETIAQASATGISGGGTMLKAQLTPSLAQSLQQRFSKSLIIEKDAPLHDPRVMPNFKL